MIRVLYVDDDNDAHRLLKISLPQGYTIISGLTAKAGIQLAERTHPDVVLLDIDLPDADGFEVLERIGRLQAPPPVIMLTGYGEIRLAVRSLRAGAADFIEKPYDRTLLLSAIRRAAHLQLTAEEQPPYAVGFIGDSRAAGDIRNLIHRFAESDRPVLITGESGTGKDLAARLIHEHSSRRSAPFIARNCSAIPGSLIESELFGSEKGAFTDAVSRPGSFELADSGTLFLDEIGEMPAAFQAKLLRVLEDGQVRRIGSRQTVPTKARIVSATNCNIRKAVENGRLRLDLYYRISTLHIHIPPLRERKEDIPPLVQGRIEATRHTISPAALEKLTQHEWPGNVRELFNVLDRAMILCDGGRLDARSIQLDPFFGGSVDFSDVEHIQNRNCRTVFQIENAE